MYAQLERNIELVNGVLHRMTQALCLTSTAVLQLARWVENGPSLGRSSPSRRLRGDGALEGSLLCHTEPVNFENKCWVGGHGLLLTV